MTKENTEQFDYRKTLNLPQTEFSMRAGLLQKEPKFLQQWEADGLYQKMKSSSADRKKFILHDGPPYANGNIHIGHALNKILKDIIVKFKRMDGFDSFYLPGWDCHGLPIEHQLLKELKKKKSDVDCVEFRKSAHDYAMKYVGIQREQFQRLGIFGEWDHPYLTLDKNYEYWILKSLASLNRKGYIYRGRKPVNWCYQCETALAEAEVEYDDHTSTSVYVKFKVNNREKINVNSEKPLSLLIWTTTPWTLLANSAVAVHANYEYAIVDLGSELVIVEKSLVGHVMSKAGQQNYSILQEFKGNDLSGLTYDHPFALLKNVRVVTADYVTKEDGTGLVHTAPGHGQDDFETGQKYNLDVLMPVNDRGVYTKDAGSYEGKHVFKANDEIVSELTANGSLFHMEKFNHSYPHCWRCKSPIIFRATHQWFLKIDHEQLRGKLNDEIKRHVQWIPESGQERILSMVNGRPDWCLSRQRYWGVPIPALIPKGQDNHARLYTEVVDYVAQIAKVEGTNAWFEKDVNDLIPPGFTCPETGATEFEKTYDILDVWFDSGVSHQAVLKGMLGAELPADLYLEGSDQHRGWFQSSLIPAVALEGKAPYKSVLTHGFVVDGNGRKMSKSLGNVISPLDIIQNSGADILRLWVASSSYHDDIRISKEVLDRMVDSYRKIRNTFRYLIGNLYNFQPESQLIEYHELLDLDKWALNQLAELMEKIKAGYDQYSFNRVYKLIYNFCNEELSNFYLDILKDRLYISATHSRERRSAQTVLYYLVSYLVRAAAPILVFTAEEIFLTIPKDADLKDIESVHLAHWPEVQSEWKNKEIAEKFELLIAMRPFVMKSLEDARSDGLIGSSLEAKIIFNTASSRDFDYLKAFKSDLPDMFVVSQVEVNKVSSVEKAMSSEFSQSQVVISKADGKKCSRSWKYSEDVGQDPDHPTLSLKSALIVKEILNAGKENN